MNLNNNIKYYYLNKVLQLLLEQGAISQAEYKQVCRYNAEFLRPDSEYIR